MCMYMYIIPHFFSLSYAPIVYCRWLDHFPSHQLLPIDGGLLVEKPAFIMEAVQRFLKVSVVDYWKILKLVQIAATISYLIHTQYLHVTVLCYVTQHPVYITLPSHVKYMYILCDALIHVEIIFIIIPTRALGKHRLHASTVYRVYMYFICGVCCLATQI